VGNERSVGLDLQMSLYRLLAIARQSAAGN